MIRWARALWRLRHRDRRPKDIDRDTFITLSEIGDRRIREAEYWQAADEQSAVVRTQTSARAAQTTKRTIPAVTEFRREKV